MKLKILTTLILTLITFNILSQDYEYNLWLLNQDDIEHKELNKTDQLYNVSLTSDSILITGQVMTISFLKDSINFKNSVAVVKFQGNTEYCSILYYQELPRWVAIKFLAPNHERAIYWFHKSINKETKREDINKDKLQILKIMEYLDVIKSLNEELNQKIKGANLTFSYFTDGYKDFIYFGDNLIWSSEMDNRKFDLETDNLEPLAPYIKKLFNEWCDRIHALRFP